MDNKNVFLEKIDKTNEQISKSPIIKGLFDGLVSLVPVLGSAISSSLDTRAFQLFEENSRIFAEEIRTIIKNLNEDKLDKEFLETPEFTSLLLEILGRNARTHEREKVRLFSKAFIAFSTKEGSTIKYKEGFIRIIDESSIEHINILAFIHNQLYSSQESDRKTKDCIPAYDIAIQFNTTTERVQAYCEQMIRYGLLRDWGIGRLDYEPGMYVITGYGIEFSEFLTSID